MKGGLAVGASQEKLLQQPETVEAVEWVCQLGVRLFVCLAGWLVWLCVSVLFCMVSVCVCGCVCWFLRFSFSVSLLCVLYSLFLVLHYIYSILAYQPTPSHLIYTAFPLCRPCFCLLCLFCLCVFLLTLSILCSNVPLLFHVSLILYPITPISYLSYLSYKFYLSYQSHHALSILLISSLHWSVHIACCFGYHSLGVTLQLASRPNALSWVEKRT